jgi:type II restriction enzyme
MDLYLQKHLANAYTSGLQRARVMTEPWVANQVYCPNCGNCHITSYANNHEVGDFYCPACKEEYELKSQRSRFGAKVADGAYPAMMRRLTGHSNPNLLLLNYDHRTLIVTNLVIVPKHFFTAEIIEERKPLPTTAKRAGWVGCSILLHAIPNFGRIPLIQNGFIEPKADVLAKWRQTLFLRKQRDIGAKGWLLHVMRCIERIGKTQFSIEDVYAFEHELQSAYPDNRHIRAKIRQRLQVLRDNGYIDFLGDGFYRLRLTID